MKYKIGNRAINSDQIVHVNFLELKTPVCDIYTTALAAGELDEAPTSDRIRLNGSEALAFWSHYSGYAIDVMAE